MKHYLLSILFFVISVLCALYVPVVSYFFLFMSFVAAGIGAHIFKM